MADYAHTRSSRKVNLIKTHPRFTMTCVVLIFLMVLVLANSGQKLPAAYFPGKHQAGMQLPVPCVNGDLKKQMQVIEKMYQQGVSDREALVKKVGPKPKDILPFPKMKGYTLWDFFTPAPAMCRHHIERVGILGDGGKWVCGLERIQNKKDCIIYSIGVNGESSFEAALLDRGENCQVYAYDFSVNSMGPEVEDIPALKKRAHFFPYMLSSESKHGHSPPQWTLPELMEKNGHTWIDILKIDIEAAEFGTLNALIDAYPGATAGSSRVITTKDTDGRSGGGLPFGQLQLEIHIYRGTEHEAFDKFLSWWNRLEAAGLRPFWTEPNLVYANLDGTRPDLAEYSFINTRGEHELISDKFVTSKA